MLRSLSLPPALLGTLQRSKRNFTSSAGVSQVSEATVASAAAVVAELNRSDFFVTRKPRVQCQLTQVPNSAAASDTSFPDSILAEVGRGADPRTSEATAARSSSGGRDNPTHSQKQPTKGDGLYSSKFTEFASVLVPLAIVDGRPSILYNVRSMRLIGHRGEISFPGGKREPATDANVVDTALRETHEELGIEPNQVDVWGCMTAMRAKSKTLGVTPVVGYVGEINLCDLRPSVDEVEEVFAVPVATLCGSYRFTRFRYLTNAHYTFPVFSDGQHRRIWGLTAFITHNVLTLFPDVYDKKLVF